MRLAVFDMDGTIIDTVADIHACLNKTLTVYSLPPVPLEVTKRFVGSGMRRLIITAAGENNFTDIMETYFRAIYKENMMNTTCVMDGAQDVFEYLRRSDIKTAILSNKIRSLVDDMVHAFGIGSYFDGWYGGDSFGVKKPDPSGLKGIMSEMGVRPENTIMIGDSSGDMLAGAAAGAKTCFCAYGYGTLKNAEADFTASSPSDIIKVLEEF